MTAWLLTHPTRASWFVLEFLRPLPWRRRFANAWWQLRWFNRTDKFVELFEQHSRGGSR